MSVSRRQILGLGMGAAATLGVGVTSAVAIDHRGAEGRPDPFAPAAAPTGAVREYWVQVDSFAHNLVPGGTDQMMGMTFKPSDSSFWAVGYRAYTPGWGSPLPADDDIGPNTGMPGPNLRASVGDTVKIHFRNNDTHYRWPHSMHTHGFRYDPMSDGGFLAVSPSTPGTGVAPGESYTYTWTALRNSVGTWLYHDHAAAQGLTADGPVMELNAELGMFGLVAITDDDTPRVDREHFLFFHDVYQADIPALAQDYDCFNGASYLGNTPTFTAKVGERVRWRVAALGKEFHVFHIHGHRWRSQATGLFTDSEMLGPSTTLTVEYTEDNPGDWIYHCHVTDHMAGGMVGRYRVAPA
jgi:FtsP/CotA-like multicopper oxidase with cupredoxin domain